MRIGFPPSAIGANAVQAQSGTDLGTLRSGNTVLRSNTCAQAGEEHRYTFRVRSNQTDVAFRADSNGRLRKLAVWSIDDRSWEERNDNQGASIWMERRGMKQGRYYAYVKCDRAHTAYRFTVTAIERGPTDEAPSACTSGRGVRVGGGAITGYVGPEDSADAYRFFVGPTTRVRVGIAALQQPNIFFVELADGNGRVLQRVNPHSDSRDAITRTLTHGSYCVRIVYNPRASSRGSSYVAHLSAVQPATIPVPPPVIRPLPPPPPPPSRPRCPNPLPVVSFAGVHGYRDHTCSTTLSPTSIAPPSSFTITTDMPLAGRTLVVYISDVNRTPGSAGVYRFRLTGVRVSGNRVIVTFPGAPYDHLRNRRWHVEVLADPYLFSRSYAYAGVLQVR